MNPDKCAACNGTGMTGWEKPMGFPPTMVFVPQICGCESGQAIARANLQKANAAAREVFTEEKYPLHPRIATARK